MLLRLLSFAGLAWMTAGMGVQPPRFSDEVLENFAAVGPPTPGQCSDPHLLSCQAKFNSDLGINGNLDWHMPWNFHYALQNIYQNNGTQGVISVCKAYRDFSQCLGTMYPACINALFFLQHGYGVQNSYTYPAILANLHFQCAGGLETLLGSFKCIENILNTKNQTLQICIATYQHDQAVYPQKGCQNAQQFLSCIRAPFNTCGAPASWYECEYTRSGIATYQNYCNPNAFRCYVGMSGEDGNEAEPELPALAYPDKASAFQAAMLEMGQGSVAAIYRSMAEHEKANGNK